MGIDLAEGFVDHHGDGAGEVERADVLGLDGDAADGIGVRGQQVVGQSLGLAAEDQRVAGAVFDVRVGPGTAGAVEEKAGGSERVEAGLPRGMDLYLDGIPIVEAGAAELGVGDLKAQRLDQMEAGAGGGAQAGDVAGVGRDFGMDEDDVERDGRPAEIEFGFSGMGVLHGGRIGAGAAKGKTFPARKQPERGRYFLRRARVAARALRLLS